MTITTETEQTLATALRLGWAVAEARRGVSARRPATHLDPAAAGPRRRAAAALPAQRVCVAPRVGRSRSMCP